MTRPAPILVPGADRARATTTRWFRAKGAPPPHPARRRRQPAAHVFRNAAGDVIRRPALQGFAALYNRAFEHSGRINVFLDCCFTTSIHTSTDEKSVLLDHDRAKLVGCVGLEFANTLDGLAFRFPLDGVERAAEIGGYIDSAAKACVSVGCVIEEDEEREIAGHKVRLITKAKLEEISLVGEGACPNTFAGVVDLDAVDDLWTEARKPGFRLAMIATTAAARVRRVTQALGRLRDHAG